MDISVIYENSVLKSVMNLGPTWQILTRMDLFGARKLRQVIQTYGTHLNQFLHILTTSENCKCKSRNTIISL
jgi:hypothetical protein